MAKPSIDLTQDLQPVSDFRANSAAVLKQVRETRRPVVLTQRGRGAAVLLDIAAYQDLVDENDALRDVLQGLDDVANGRTTESSEARKRLLGGLAG